MADILTEILGAIGGTAAKDLTGRAIESILGPRKVKNVKNGDTGFAPRPMGQQLPPGVFPAPGTPIEQKPTGRKKVSRDKLAAFAASLASVQPTAPPIAPTPLTPAAAPSVGLSPIAAMDPQLLSLARFFRGRV